MEKLSEAFFEREVEESAHRFIVYFLYDDEDQSVLVEEVEEVDFLEVIHHLNFGGSVFITHRRSTTRTEEQVHETLCVGKGDETEDA